MNAATSALVVARSEVALPSPYVRAVTVDCRLATWASSVAIFSTSTIANNRYQVRKRTQPAVLSSDRKDERFRGETTTALLSLKRYRY